MEKTRNKVAHNTLFTLDDLHKAEQIFEALNQILIEADKEIDTLVFEPILPVSSNDNEYLGDKYSPEKEEDQINESSFMKTLLKTEKDFEQKGWKNLGLKFFVYQVLNLSDGDSAHGYRLAQNLREQGKIEILQEPNKHGVLVTNVRSKKKEIN